MLPLAAFAMPHDTMMLSLSLRCRTTVERAAFFTGATISLIYAATPDTTCLRHDTPMPACRQIRVPLMLYHFSMMLAAAVTVALLLLLPPEEARLPD